MSLNNVYLYSHRPSNGARDLAQALQAKRIRTSASAYVPKPHHTIINWGSGAGHFPYDTARILNRPELVTRASNKLAFFQHLQGTSAKDAIVAWTVDQAVARSWVTEGGIAVARGVLSGHSGDGITIIENLVDFVAAPLYTKYVKKEAEYRVHCINDDLVPSETYFNTTCRAFDVQRKIKDPAFEGTPNWRVRNHQNGFIFIRDNLQIPEAVTGKALQAFEASGLDFGAVDVIWNSYEQRAYVLEINTAPGLIGRSLVSYKAALTSAIAGS